MEKTSRFVYQIIITCGLILYIFVVGLMIYGENFWPDERNYTDFSLEDYSDGWQRLDADGSYKEIVDPGEYEMSVVIDW